MMFASAAVQTLDEDAAQEMLFARKTSDGLPVVLPTPARVEKMLMNAGGLEPDFVLGDIPPLGGCLTVEKLAINAVMAGCSAAMFPIVIAGARP